MRRRFLQQVCLLALATGTGVPAEARTKTEYHTYSDVTLTRKYEIAPPPSWILPATIPAAPVGAQGASTIDLLSDSQVRFSRGESVNYSNAIYKIETAQGLDDGAIQIDWDPALEKITLHHIRLIRDGRQIDLLGDGSKLTVARREKNLEKAAIDGRLTILLQPEDLRIGDVVDYSYTRARHDPAMGGHFETFMGPRDGASVGRSRIRMLWPSSLRVKWRAMPGVVQPIARPAAGNEVELLSDLVNLTTKEPPQGAPSRFRSINAVQVSDFADWSSVSANLEPLYTNAAALAPDSAVHAEISRIAEASSDPRVRAEMALALVQEKVRYLLLEMNGGGYQPAGADLTWSRRYGDCKAKTVLLIAILRGLGITASPVLVSTTAGDAVAETLPSMGAFDHVLVRATIGGRDYWLDGTRLGDRRLAQIRTPSFKFGLPILAAGARLVELTPEPLAAPTEDVDIAIDASAGIDVPAPVKAEMRFRGDGAIDKRLEYAGLSPADRDEALRKFWRKNYDFITPAKVTIDDTATGDFVLAMTGTAKMDWSGEAGTRWYEVDGARVGWKFDINRDGQLNADAPFAFDYPDWWAKHETVKLPYGGKDFKLQGGNVDESVGGLYAFHRSVRIEGGVMAMESSTRALSGELPASKAAAARARMAELAAVGVYIRKPDDYLPTDADITALKDDHKALAAALLERGAHRFDAGQADASLADIDAALAIDSSIATSHAIRAMILANKMDPRADAAADKALAIDPKSWMALNAKGTAALLAKHYALADDYYSRSLAIEPSFMRSLAGRGTARMMLGTNDTGALADFDAALLLQPTAALHGPRAVVLTHARRNDEAIAELDIALAKDKSNYDLRHLRALNVASAGRIAEALPAYNALIAEKPSVDLYLERASLRSGTAQASADVDEALRLNPKSTKALLVHASYAIDDGNLDKAEADLASIERTDPGNRGASTVRVQLLSKTGKRVEALRVADAAVDKYKDATALNERCWLKATLNIAFESALADCNKGLSLAPNSPALLDSRGFVELRAGSIDAALADYDAALKLYPKMAASLFGRGLARQRKGNNADAEADLAEARRLAPEIEARFASYGMRPSAGLNPK